MQRQSDTHFDADTVARHLEQVVYWHQRFKETGDVDHHDNTERHANVVREYFPCTSEFSLRALETLGVILNRQRKSNHASSNGTYMNHKTNTPENQHLSQVTQECLDRAKALDPAMIIKSKPAYDWPDPVALPSLPPVDQFDVSLLPRSIRPWIVDIADRMQVPLDFPAVTAMVMGASLVGRRCGIYPKEKDSWLVVPNLWGAIVGRPALLKSPAMSEVLKAMDPMIRKAELDYEAKSADYESHKLIQESRMKALKSTLDQAAKGKETSNEELEMIAASRKEIAEIAPSPFQRRYKTEDGTVEKIGEILRDNPQGILIHRDELIGFLKSLDKQGREMDRSFYLESWNGTGSFSVDRIGRGSLNIPALCLSVIGSIQPGPLESYARQATSSGAGDDGLLQRFQLLVWPDAPQSWQNIDRLPNVEARDQAFRAYERLDKIHLPSGEDCIPAIRFDQSAQVVFNTWRNELERRLRNDIHSPALESHIAKYRSLMPSLALIAYLLDTMDSGGEIIAVTEEYVYLAIRWCKYLESHAVRLYSSAVNPSLDSAKELLKRIKKGDIKDGFSPRDVYRKQWSKLKDTKETERAIGMLVDYGWIALTCSRPESYTVHPSIKVKGV
jgi:putative DNA primase/helicase